MMSNDNRALRALLLASASVVALAVSPVSAADTVVTAGAPLTSMVSVSGIDTVTVQTAATLGVTTGTAVQWSANATGTGIVINNAGTLSTTGTGTQTYAAPNGTFMWDGPSAIVAANGIAGTMTVNNNGTISSATGPAIFTGPSGSGSSVIINNNASGVITGAGGGKLNANVIPATVAMYLGNGNDVVNNYGKINGAVLLGPGDDIFNAYNGAFDAVTGAINGNLGNNVINLLDPNGGYAHGHSEAPATGSLSIGWDAIQTVNVQKGNWTLVGAALWSNLTVASGAGLVVCDAAACKPAGQSSTDNGYVPLSAATIVNNGTLTFNTGNAVPYFHTAQGAVAMTGAGKLIYAGTGVNYLPANLMLSGFTGSVAVSGGKLVLSGIIAHNLTVASGATLQIGSGGTLINRDGVATDNGTAGALNVLGTNTITVASGGTITAINGSGLTWSGNATGAGIVINNAGTLSTTATGTKTYVAPNGTFTWDGPSAIVAANGITGTMTINNDGIISSATGPAIFTGPSGAGSSVIINNNASGVITGAGGGKLNANVIPATVAMYLGNGNDVVNNYGKINGAVLLGPGDDVFNAYNGAFNATGAINGNLGNNVINLVDPNGGYAHGHSEAPATGSLSIGWDAIQTVNVQKGNWTLVGAALWNNLNVASGAGLVVCDAAACKPAGQSSTDNGYVPLSAGTIVNNGTLTFNTDNAVPYTHANQGAIALSGNGKLLKAGTGTIFLASSNTVQQKDIEIAAGTLVTSAVISGATVIDPGATLQIGSGGTLINRDGVNLDNGTFGNITGSIVDNGTLVFNRLDDFTMTADLSGNGSIVKMNANTATLTGKYTFTGTTQILGGKLLVGGTLSANSSLQVGAGTSVNLQGSSQTVAGLSDAPVVSSGTPGPAATVDLGGGSLTVNQAVSSSFSGNLAGNGTLNVNAGGVPGGAGSSTLVLNGNSSGFSGTTNITGGTLQIGSASAPTASLGGTVNVSGGKLEVGDANAPGATLTGSVAVNAGGSLGGHGTITGSVTNAGTTAPGGSIGTLHVAGNYTFAAGSLLEQEVAANGATDLLQADGTVSIANGATVQVQPEGAISSYGRVTNYTIVIGAGGVSGTFSVVSATAGFTPILSYGSTAVNLALVRSDISLTTVAATTNQFRVAAAVNAGGGALYTAVAPNADAVVRQSLDLVSGEIHATLLASQSENAALTRRIVLNRMRDAQDYKAGWSVWGNVSGDWGSIDGDSNAAGATRSGVNLSVGADTSLDENWRGGIEGGYSSSNLGVAARASGADMQSGQIGAYAHGRYGAVVLRVGGTYGFGTAKTIRAINFARFSDTASARQDTSTVQLFDEAGYRVAFGSVTLEPFVGIAWTHLKAGAFRETGGSAALTGAVRDMDDAFSTAGFAASAPSFNLGGAALTPSLRAGWQHAFTNNPASRSLAFISSAQTFTVLGAPLDADRAVIDLNAALALSGNAEVTLGYSGMLGTHASDHAVNLKGVFKF